MRIVLAIVLVAYAGFTWWFVDSLASISKHVSNLQRSLAEPSPVPAAIVRFDGVKKGLVVPSWSHLELDTPWAYVSSSSSIDKSYVPELITISVDTGDWLADKRLRTETNQALKELFADAKPAGHPLIVTSAYRSALAQRDLYKSSTERHGADWARSHIAHPGESEHQLGLSADLSTLTPACQIDFSSCHLEATTAQWLEDNAHRHGFIVRYPKSKQHITGIAHEPWHFRYVGHDMAGVVYESGLTFDEISRKLQTLSAQDEPLEF